MYVEVMGAYSVMICMSLLKEHRPIWGRGNLMHAHGTEYVYVYVIWVTPVPAEAGISINHHMKRNYTLNRQGSTTSCYYLNYAQPMLQEPCKLLIEFSWGIE